MIEVLKQAFEALKDVGVLTDREWQAVHKNKANELRQAIAELESQEPSAWVELTDEEVNNAIKEKNITPLFTYRMIARIIEAKLKQKNGFTEENT